MSQNSRMYSRHNKRKKSNTLINILIGVVFLLIIIVGWNIISGDEETVNEVEKENPTSVEQTEQETNKEDEEKELGTQEIEEDGESASESETPSGDSSTEEPNEEEQIVTEESDDPNVAAVEINQNWQPIGTSQTGEHVSIYDTESVDWKEKVRAISYATNLDESNMYIKRIENGGSPQKSIGTVTSKDQKEIYRVYLEWVDGQGWKPTKKETLISLP